MPVQVQIRRGDAEDHETFTGVNGEVTFDTDARAIRTHDGTTLAGFLHALQHKGSDVASASSLDLTGSVAAGDFLEVSGTTGINGILLRKGERKTLRFQDSVIITPSSSLLIPGGVAITTEADDLLTFRGDDSDVVFLESFMKACPGADLHSNLLTLADDTAVAIPVPGTSRTALVALWQQSAVAPHPKGHFWVRTSASGASCSNIAFASTTNITFTTGALSGTTGTDGNFTISGHTDGNLYFENRKGSSATIRYSMRALDV